MLFGKKNNVHNNGNCNSRSSGGSNGGMVYPE